MQYAIGLNQMESFYDYLFKLCYNKFLLIYFFYVLKNTLIGHHQNVEALNLILLIIKQFKKNLKGAEVCYDNIKRIITNHDS